MISWIQIRGLIISFIIVGHLLDWITTIYALNLGYWEISPLWIFVNQKTVEAYVLFSVLRLASISLPVLGYYYLGHLIKKEQNKAVWIMKIIYIAGGLAVVFSSFLPGFHNLSVIL